jgi:hypothetical protein
MLVTHESWLEQSEAMKNSVLPFDAWEAVGLTYAEPSLLVMYRGPECQGVPDLRSFLLSSAETFVKLMEQMPSHHASCLRGLLIHEANVEEITEFWSYRSKAKSDRQIFVYRSRGGVLKPFYPKQKIPRAGYSKVRLANFLIPQL